MHWLSPFCYMEVEFGPLEKRIKKFDQSIWKFSEEQTGTPFVTTKEWRNLERVESRTSWRETKKIQIKLATTFTKNEQQENAKINTEL